MIGQWLSGARKSATAGEQAERFSARFLARQGLRVLATNYRSRRGEIDIVARHGDSLVFVEVRLRNHRGFASGAESVDAVKQRKLAAAAAHYLQEHFGDRQPPCRFDVIALVAAPDSGDQYRVEWLQDAFRPEP